MRAADALRRHTGCRAGAAIRLTKRIPMQAGLGGGSSDAATTLVGLNRLWGLDLSAEELATLAASLGSDVAFFLDGPAAWCTGRGEEVSPRTIGRQLHFVLVSPPFGLATADVYRGVAVPPTPVDGSAISSRRWRRAMWKRSADGCTTACSPRPSGFARSCRSGWPAWRRPNRRVA